MYRKIPSKRTLYCSIKTGTLAIAALDIISAVAFLILGSLGLVYGYNGQKSVLVTVISSFTIGGSILDLALTALLVSAVTENKPRRCLPWLIFNYIGVLWRYIMLIISVISGNILLMLLCGIYTGVQLYFISVVHQFKDRASADYLNSQISEIVIAEKMILNDEESIIYF